MTDREIKVEVTGKRMEIIPVLRNGREEIEGKIIRKDWLMPNRLKGSDLRGEKNNEEGKKEITSFNTLGRTEGKICGKRLRKNRENRRKKWL